MPVVDTLFLIITPTNITVFAGNDSLVCGDDSLGLNGVINTALGGVWSTSGDGQFSPNDSTLSPQYLFGPNDTSLNFVEFILTTTGNGGCLPQTDTLLINIQDPLILTTTSLDTICRNDGLFDIESISSTTEGFWSTLGDGNFLNSIQLNTEYLAGTDDLTSNEIILYFTTTNNGVCNALVDTLNIEVINAPIANFNFDNVCLNETSFFTDSSTTIGNIANWNWTFNDSITSTNQNPSIEFTTVGTQTATLIVESNYGCIDTLTQNTIIHPLPIANFNSNAACYVDSAELFDASSISTGTNVQWNWIIDNGFSASGENISVIFDSAGTYNTTLIVTSDLGCVDTIIGLLEVKPNPVALFSSDSVCLNNTSTLFDLSTVEFGQVVSWHWELENGEIDSIQNTDFIFSSDGQQPVTLIVTSSDGCSDTITQNVIIHPLPNALFSYEGFCEEDDVLFTDESTISSGQITGWLWDFDSDSSNIQFPSYGFGTQGIYNVELSVFSEFGCLDTISQNIIISPNPTADFSISNSFTQVLDLVYFTDQSIDASVWYWDFGDGLGFSTDQSPNYAYGNFGQYSIELIIENQFGCTDTAIQTITVKQPPLLPLAFSPNNDGLNDVFSVLGGYFMEFQFIIYNNWGKQIYISQDPDLGWDGTYNNEEQPIGVYVYLLKVVTEDGVEYNLHGDVTLIR